MVDMLLDDDAATVFFDGTTTDPQLDHPEGVAVHPDGSVWCGGERGQIYRLDPDGRDLVEVGSTGGFCLGMAFDSLASSLYVCDLKLAAVFRVEVASGRVERFADGGPDGAFKVPNFPAFGPDGHLFVSDSHAFRVPGPGIWRVDGDGRATLWFDRDLNFANGLAFDATGRFLSVAETFGNRISRIEVREDGTAGDAETFSELGEAWPDGLAFDVEGNLYVGCYEPSQILRVDATGRPALLYREASAHTLAHPTNVAFRGSTMFTANLGRWHVTRIEVGVEGLALPVAAR
ncbi:MAG TPA: SMP-30/gluconolactonase/LRE family protein [Actinomycetota bacterium]|jgi:sugar lactone lactonase YvrE|nr:SMP-30/gluconolactonase/LRE family protein [Actinomycetota bacterium]